MKQLFFIAMFVYSIGSFAQELFVMTDPASNVPAKSLSINTMNSLFKLDDGSGMNYHVMPELTYGLNSRIMLRGSSFISNRNNSLYFEGGNLLIKYRYFSRDDMNSHFRMAAYARASINRADIHQEQIEILGHNSGYELGLIGTKLIHKLALSSSFSYERAGNNTLKYAFPSKFGNEASNYTFSVGKLIYPKKYTNYRQTNVNLMLEFVGQLINANGKHFLDVVPAVQFIINSQGRIDLAYRYEIQSTMVRTAPNGFYLNFYYTFFNLKRDKTNES